MIETALVAGFTSVGFDVLLLGPMPTPAVAMLTGSMQADVGVIISALHNACDDNGIKFFGPDGCKLPDETKQEIEELIDSDLSKHLASWLRLAAPNAWTARMTATSNSLNAPAPRSFARRTAGGGRLCSWRGLPVAPQAALGAQCRGHLDRGRVKWPQHKPRLRLNGPASLDKVREMRADIGIAFNGDSDRVIVADEHGHLIDGDQILAVIAEEWQEDGRLARPGIVATTMDNMGLSGACSGFVRFQKTLRLAIGCSVAPSLFSTVAQNIFLTITVCFRK